MKTVAKVRRSYNINERNLIRCTKQDKFYFLGLIETSVIKYNHFFNYNIMESYFV